jgi:hypothetical protein
VSAVIVCLLLLFFFFIDTGLSHRLGLKIDDEHLSIQLTTDINLMLIDNDRISSSTMNASLLQQSRDILQTIGQQRVCALRVLNHKPHATVNLRLIQIARGLVNRSTQICVQLMECMRSIGCDMTAMRQCKVSFSDLLSDAQTNDIGVFVCVQFVYIYVFQLNRKHI